MPEIIPKIRTAIFLLLISLIFSAFAAALVVGLLAADLENARTLQWAMLLGELLMPVPVIFWARRYATHFFRFFRMQPVANISIAAAIPMGIGLPILMDEITHLAQKLWPLPETSSNIDAILGISNLSSAVLVIGMVVILAPFAEELVFRGFFQRILEYRLSDVTKAALFSALTFALVHFNPWWVLQIYITGIFLGYVAWRTDSIVIAFLLHMLYNGFDLMLANLNSATLALYEWKGHVSPLVLLVALGLFLLGMQLFIRVTPVAERPDDVIMVEDLFKHFPNLPH
jgi:membrane protease YdiL (CAAX protease family)